LGVISVPFFFSNTCSQGIITHHFWHRKFL
jgi:hypothetical protein